MTRVHLDIPEQFIFSIDIPLRTGDINYGGHLGHDAVLSLVQEARASMLAAFGYTEADIEGPGLIIADAVLVYKSEAFYGEVLVIRIAVGDWSTHGCGLYYAVTEKETGREVARVKTGIVFFDYAERKIASVPARFRERIETSPTL